MWFILSLIPSFIYLFYKSQKSLQMLQQNWYDDGNRYLKWLFNNLGKVLGNIDVLIILLVWLQNIKSMELTLTLKTYMNQIKTYTQDL